MAVVKNMTVMPTETGNTVMPTNGQRRELHMEEEYAEETPAEETTVEETPVLEAEESTEELPEEETPTEPEEKKQPLIPRKAYESEKEKRQRLEAENRELKHRLETQPAAEPKAPATVEEAFDHNPAGTLSYIDSEIRKARAEYDQDRVTELVDLKATLATRAMLNMEGKNSAAAERAKIDADIFKVVPDFDTKKPELIQAAVEMGYDEKTAADLLNPDVVGIAAVQSVKAFNKFHSLLNASKTARTKEVKTAPKTEPAGNGGFSNNNHFQKQFTKAKESGRIDDWAAILG